jgi:hypothetical protein
VGERTVEENEDRITKTHTNCHVRLANFVPKKKTNQKQSYTDPTHSTVTEDSSMPSAAVFPSSKQNVNQTFVYLQISHNKFVDRTQTNIF